MQVAMPFVIRAVWPMKSQKANLNGHAFRHRWSPPRWGKLSRTATTNFRDRVVIKENQDVEASKRLREDAVREATAAPMIAS